MSVLSYGANVTRSKYRVRTHVLARWVRTSARVPVYATDSRTTDSNAIRVPRVRSSGVLNVRLGARFIPVRFLAHKSKNARFLLLKNVKKKNVHFDWLRDYSDRTRIFGRFFGSVSDL